jgi:hypothetical protein
MSILRDGWVIGVDPSHSPKQVPFGVAVMFLKHGRRIRKKEWRHAWIDYDKNDGLRFHRGYDDVFMKMDELPVSVAMDSKWDVLP